MVSLIFNAHHILGLKHVIAKEIKNCTYCCYVSCATLKVLVGRMPWPKRGATQYHNKSSRIKGCTIKELVVCNNLDLEPLDLLNGTALGCFLTVPQGMNRIPAYRWDIIIES